MRTYTLRGLGREPRQSLAGVIESFWQPWGVKVTQAEPLPEASFPTRKSLTDWVYQLYRQHHDQGTSPDLILVIPAQYLGLSWRLAWEGTAWDGYQIALVKEQMGPGERFVAVHEVSHLLGLKDHFWPLNCISSWYPWWLIPLSLRTICPKCRKILAQS